MPDPYKHLENILNECAAYAASEAADPWPTIRERVAGRQERPARRFRLVPRTRARWALAALLVLILSIGAYAASGLVYETFVSELPGAEGPVFGQKIDQTQTADGARIILEWAYADARFVVIGFDLENLREGRRIAEYPAELQPILITDKSGYEARLEEEYPQRVRLTDESGNEFRVVSSQGQTSEAPDNIVEGSQANSAVFEAPNGVEPSGNHRFRLAVPLQESAITSPEERMPEPEPIGETFVFEFEVPVRPVPIMEVNQKDTASGVTLSLERVSNSPGRPQAVICFMPPDDEHGWLLSGGDLTGDGEPVPGKDDCWEMLLNEPLEGRSSLTVEQIWRFPPCPPGNDEACVTEERTILRGPWTFEFKAP